MPWGSSIHITVSPQDSVTVSRMTGSPAAANRACSWPTSRTWTRPSPSAPARRMRSQRPRAIPGRGRNRPRMAHGAELPVDSQAQHFAVEAQAAVQVAGPHEDPAAQNVHATTPPSRWVTPETRLSAR